MKNAKPTLQLITLLTLTAVFLAACTKQLSYKETFKDEVQEKATIDTSAEYLYVPSTDLSNHESMAAAGARPYWQGEETVVKFRFTEKALEAYAVENEERQRDNITNERLVMTIPIEHKEYRCAKDRYGKCKNEEEENKEVRWNETSRFKPKMEEAKMIQVSLLPVQIEKLIGLECHKESGSRLLKYEITPDAINIQQLKTFTASLACLGTSGLNKQMTNLQTQIVYHYSFAKMKSLASPNYKAIDYPRKDESTFGFFTTENRKYDVDYTRSERNAREYMNRWNPERNEIVYYYSENFNKPQFAGLKAATEKAFEKTNKGLEAAGVKFRLVLKDGKGKAPGDIRNSMIVLVEDPIATGPLGYGPTVANPRTGEILSGRTVMYYGNFLQSVRYAYDELVREVKTSKRLASGLPNTVKMKVAPSQQMQNEQLMHQFVKNQTVDRLSKEVVSKFEVAERSAVSNNLGSQFADSRVQNLGNLTRRQFEKATLERANPNPEDLQAFMSKHCNYPAELFPFDEILLKGLQGKLGADLKPWAELTDEQKQNVLDLVLPEAWVPTLIHELGHNLGLRHNFNGSEDKANFYNKQELAAMGVQHEIPYSSVMDYGYSELNQLPTLGKYDVAALKFGYNRTVETVEGKVLPIATTLKDLEESLKSQNVKLKDFRFCTDEHVDVNPGCKRFDKGTTLVEIVDHLISQYDAFYFRRNFRNGAENFSRMDDAAYYSARRANFLYIRAFMERYKSIKHRFNLADDAKEWNEIEFLKDLKEAAIKSARFFQRVIKTPEILCAVAKKDAPDAIIAIQPLSTFTKDGFDCFKHVQLRPEFIVVGQAGKAFNSLKDPNSENAYADQIDIRGIYPDKLAAVNSLFSRRTGNSSYDKNEDNYLDFPEVRDEVAQTFLSVLFNKVVEDVTFTTADGRQFVQEKLHYPLFSSPEDNRKQASIHWIEAPLSPLLGQRMGLPATEISFQQMMVNIAVNGMQTPGRRLDRGLIEQISVIRDTQLGATNSTARFDVIDIGARRYYATEKTPIARQLFAFSKINTTLDKIERKKIIEYFNKKVQERRAAATTPAATGGSLGGALAGLFGSGQASSGAAAAPAPAVDAEIVAMDQFKLEEIQAYLQGAIMKNSELEYILTFLPAL